MWESQIKKEIVTPYFCTASRDLLQSASVQSDRKEGIPNGNETIPGQLPHTIRNEAQPYQIHVPLECHINVDGPPTEVVESVQRIEQNMPLIHEEPEAIIQPTVYEDKIVEVPQTFTILKPVYKKEVRELIREVPKIVEKTIDRVVEVPDIQYAYSFVKSNPSLNPHLTGYSFFPATTATTNTPTLNRLPHLNKSPRFGNETLAYHPKEPQTSEQTQTVKTKKKSVGTQSYFSNQIKDVSAPQSTINPEMLSSTSACQDPYSYLPVETSTYPSSLQRPYSFQHCRPLGYSTFPTSSFHYSQVPFSSSPKSYSMPHQFLPYWSPTEIPMTPYYPYPPEAPVYERPVPPRSSYPGYAQHDMYPNQPLSSPRDITPNDRRPRLSQTRYPKAKSEKNRVEIFALKPCFMRNEPSKKHSSTQNLRNHSTEEISTSNPYSMQSLPPYMPPYYTPGGNPYAPPHLPPDTGFSYPYHDWIHPPVSGFPWKYFYEPPPNTYHYPNWMHPGYWNLRVPMRPTPTANSYHPPVPFPLPVWN